MRKIVQTVYQATSYDNVRWSSVYITSYDNVRWSAVYINSYDNVRWSSVYIRLLLMIMYAGLQCTLFLE